MAGKQLNRTLEQNSNKSMKIRTISPNSLRWRWLTTLTIIAFSNHHCLPLEYVFTLIALFNPTEICPLRDCDMTITQSLHHKSLNCSVYCNTKRDARGSYQVISIFIHITVPLAKKTGKKVISIIEIFSLSSSSAARTHFQLEYAEECGHTQLKLVDISLTGQFQHFFLHTHTFTNQPALFHSPFLQLSDF